MYGYLEIQREALAHYPHSLVFWLTPGEREMMVRKAPNFWSQRSGVFDFYGARYDGVVANAG